MKMPISQLVDVLNRPDTLSTLPTEDIPSLLGEVEGLRARLSARLTQPNGAADRSSPPDRRLDIKAAAEKLGMSKDYLYRHLQALPFTIRVGRSVGFSEQGIEKWLRQRAGR